MSLNSSDALALVAAAHQAATELGVAITCCVVDAGARELVTARMDGAGWFTPDIARSKAMSSATLGSDSGELVGLITKHPELEYLIGDQMPVPFTTLAGGVVVREGGAVIGAVAVSGATSEQDVEVARAAVAAVRG